MEHIKYLLSEIQKNIDSVKNDSEENAEDLAALKETVATHTTEISGLKAVDTAMQQQLQEIKNSVATMDEFLEIMGN